MPPSADWQQLSEAAAYAFSIHGAQIRKGANTPYIGHLMSVAGLVLEHGGDQEQAVAGLLHDAQRQSMSCDRSDAAPRAADRAGRVGLRSPARFRNIRR